MRYAVYRDGDHDGVRSDDMRGGATSSSRGRFRSRPATRVSVGIHPGTPAIPPERGLLSGDPIRFGSRDILSFSPLGTATPGTFYLMGDGAQAAVRVTAGTARVRLMIWRGGRWRER